MRDDSYLESEIETESRASKWRSKAATAFGAAASIVILVAVVAWSYRLGVQDATEIPVIRAELEATKERPEDPGGLEVAHQDRAVYGGADFAPAYRAALDAGFVQGPEGYARATRLAMAPWPFRLEEISGAAFGPATPLLDLMRLPGSRRTRLQPPRHMNRRRDPETLDQLLTLNRSELDKEALKRAKDALLGR